LGGKRISQLDKQFVDEVFKRASSSGTPALRQSKEKSIESMKMLADTIN
jgi:hypothetical protein